MVEHSSFSQMYNLLFPVLSRCTAEKEKCLLRTDEVAI